MSSALDHLRKTYDMVAENYAALLPDASAEETLDHAMLAEFTSRVSVRGALDVLDAGCGPGRMTPSLRAAGLQVYSCDLSSAMARIAHTGHDVPAASASIAALPFRNASFGGVLAWYSIIHTAPVELPTVFAEGHRVLQTGGHILLGFQTGQGSRHIAHAYGHDIDLDAELHDSSAVAAQLTACGFEIIATLVRAPTPPYQLPQGMILARRR